MSPEQAEKKIARMKDENDRKVGSLFLSLDFELLDSNANIIRASTNQEIGEIDLLFLESESLFIVEVSKQKSKSNPKILAFFEKWCNKDNIEEVIKTYGLAPKNVFRIYFNLSSSSKSSDEIQRINSEPYKKIVYLEDYEYFDGHFKKIGVWAKNDFLDFIGYEPDLQFEPVDAIQYYIGDTQIFCFVQRVDKLLKACYVSRRRTMDHGYQRALKQSRISQISKNIERGEGLIFPNSILINARDIMVEFDANNHRPKAMQIGFPISFSTCKIIDGQHRLLGFSKLPIEEQKKHYLPVIALKAYKLEKEVKTFIDINSKQQKINENLILSLKSDFEWNKAINPKEYKDKIAVKVAEKLNTNFFKSGIFFGMDGEQRAKKISLSTIVRSMRDNNLLFEDLPTTWSNIAKTFSIISKNIPFGNDSFFRTNSGIRILFRLINIFEKNPLAQKISVTEEEFYQDLGKILDTSTVNNLKKYYGTFGLDYSATSSLIEEMRKSNKRKYSRIQSNLGLLRTKK